MRHALQMFIQDWLIVTIAIAATVAAHLTGLI